MHQRHRKQISYQTTLGLYMQQEPVRFLTATALWCAHGALDDGWLTSRVRSSCYGSSVKLGLIWC